MDLPVAWTRAVFLISSTPCESLGSEINPMRRVRGICVDFQLSKVRSVLTFLEHSHGTVARTFWVDIDSCQDFGPSISNGPPAWVVGRWLVGWLHLWWICRLKNAWQKTGNNSFWARQSSKEYEVGPAPHLESLFFLLGLRDALER